MAHITDDAHGGPIDADDVCTIENDVDGKCNTRRSPPRASPRERRTGWLGSLKVVIPVVVGLGTIIGGLVTFGERISTISLRIDRALVATVENSAWIKAGEQRVVALEYQGVAAAKERAELTAQIAQQRGVLATQLDELRRERETSNFKLGRIEGQLEDLRSAVGRLESMRSGWLRQGWEDAKRGADPRVEDRLRR